MISNSKKGFVREFQSFYVIRGSLTSSFIVPFQVSRVFPLIKQRVSSFFFNDMHAKGFELSWIPLNSHSSFFSESCHFISCFGKVQESDKAFNHPTFIPCYKYRWVTSPFHCFDFFDAQVSAFVRRHLNANWPFLCALKSGRTTFYHFISKIESNKRNELDEINLLLLIENSSWKTNHFWNISQAIY